MPIQFESFSKAKLMFVMYGVNIPTDGFSLQYFKPYI